MECLVTIIVLEINNETGMAFQTIFRPSKDNVHCGISIGEKSLIQLLCISMFRILRNNIAVYT